MTGIKIYKSILYYIVYTRKKPKALFYGAESLQWQLKIKFSFIPAIAFLFFFFASLVFICEKSLYAKNIHWYVAN